MTAPVFMPYWPALLDQASAARYCSLTVPAFEREMAIGRLPFPILIDNKKRWLRKSIDKSIEAIDSGGDWRSSSPLYAKRPDGDGE